MESTHTGGDAPAIPPSSPVFRYRFANVEFDESVSALWVEGQAVDVEPLPLNLLAMLLRRPNEVVTRAELFESLWQGRPTVDHVLANAVNKLRKALGEQGAARLVNLPRVGYRLVGPVERLAMGRQATAPVALEAGQPVPGRDGYRLERPLGASRSSGVWLARDTRLPEVRVFKFAVDGDRLAALKREYTVYRVLRQELGERDDVARLIAANFSMAPYFLEYEYGGPDLLSWAAEGERLVATPRPQRIALFVQIARAVSAAHAVGVLHKDLKPANVLMGGQANGWVARLTDFGSSRLLEPGRLAELGVTAMGMTMTEGADAASLGGTPLYLAPELLAGQSPTTRSDLYALGLMLYQLLVGDLGRPMSTGWQRDIGDELLVDDLTACTEGRPDARLNSVAELVERLERLEQRRAERAARVREAERASEAATQLQKSRARRPWVMAAFAALALGLGASLWSYAQANAALRKAEQESVRAQSINDFLNNDLLQSADVMRSGTHKAVSVLDVLQRASDRAAQRFKGQPRTEASVHKQLGDIFFRMRFTTQADQQYTQALALLSPLASPHDPELLSIRFGLVHTLTWAFRQEEAMKRLEEAERAAGPELLAERSDLALLAARVRLEVLMDAQKNKEALPAALRVLELSDTLPGADTSARFDARQTLSELYLRLDEKPKADALLAELMAPPYGERNVADVLYSRTKLQLARERINEGKLDEAELLLTQVRDTLTRAYGPNEVHVGLANSELADLHQTRGQFALAAVAARAALEAFTASMGAQHSFVTIATINLATVEIDLGESATGLRRIDDIRPQALTHRHAATILGPADFARARALTALGRPAEALAILKALDVAAFAQGSWGARDQQWETQAETARALMALGQRKQGAELLRPAVAEMEKAGSAPWLVARYRKLLTEPQRMAQR